VWVSVCGDVLTKVWVFWQCVFVFTVFCIACSVFVLFRLCIFILIFFVCISVKYYCQRLIAIIIIIIINTIKKCRRVKPAG